MGVDASELAARHCKPCAGGTPPLSLDQVERYLASVTGWRYAEGSISKRFEFKNYYQTMAFVNAAAWVSHREDHHPDMAVGYNECRVSYITHAINGLSENDFICAAKLDALFEI